MPRIVSDTTRKKIVKVKGVEIGGNIPIIIGGPCAVENEEHICKIAMFIKKYGASMLRGGAYKPRTSPYSFQGLKDKGLEYLYNAGKISGLPVISELLDIRDIDIVCRYVDIIQIGSRNMQNFSLLREVGKLGKPVMLKRGMAATIEEWLNAAEYIASEGNENIVLCERGIRTYETYTRNTLDLAAVPVIKSMCMLPIIVDPSHGTGRRELITSMSLASIAAGADGVMMEVHEYPEIAMSDGGQSINLEEFSILSKKIIALSGFIKTITN